MYIAEIRGKLSSDLENKEDVLTSNVFSFFKYAPRHIFLSAFLKLLDIEVSKNELLEANFIFWPTYEDGTEPDLVIIVGQFYLLIEAKYFSGFSQENEFVSHQLEREHKNGRKQAKQLGKKFVITTITADLFNKPGMFENVNKSIKNELRWVNWHKVAKILEGVLLETELSKEIHEFANDLFLLLQKKGFQNFIGIERLTSSQKINQNLERVFFDISTVKSLDVFQGFSQIYKVNIQNGLDHIYIYFNDKRKIFNFKDVNLLDIDNEIFYRRINGKERDY